MKSCQNLLKKILVLSLIGCIVFTTTFFSYENTITVEAADYEDLLRDAVYVGLAAFGVVTAVSGGATLTPALLLPFITNIAGTGFDIYDYVTDNGDGTTTVSEEFIKIVGQAYQQYKEENADLFDGNLNMTQDGYYYFPSCEVTVYHPDFGRGFTGTVRFTDIYSFFPCAIYIQTVDNGLIPHIIYYNYASDKFYSMNLVYGSDSKIDKSIEKPSTFSMLNPKLCTKTYVDVGIYQVYFDSFGIGCPNFNSLGYITVNSSSIPVYHDLNALKQGLKTEDFSAAFNYGTIPDMESSKYTGFYEGGDITVTNEKLSGISDKLDEINETEKDIDSKLQDLLDWLGIGNGGSGTGGNDSGILSDLLSALSSYFDSVLAYLDSILTSIQGLIYVETVKPDTDDGYDLSDMINDVWEDPENGSQTVADSLSASFSDIGSALMAKFPFCIPNDLYSLFNVFANIPESRAAPMSLEEDGIQTYAESGSAPRFELPLVIESFGVDEVIIIDMESFTPLSKNARVFLSLIFAVALMKFSAVVIGFINDAWG